MKPDLVSGSPLWQTVFISVAVLIMLLQILRGWRLGLPRQLVRLGALIAAYAAAIFGGKLLLPLFGSLLKAPDFVLSALGGAVLAMIVYSLINTIGVILFKRTGQQVVGPVRLVYGITGAVLGIFFGLFFLWLMVVGIRSLGAVAQAEVNSHAPANIAPLNERKARTRTEPIRTTVPDQNSLTFSLARLKKSIELGPVGKVVKQTDVLPGGVYETLGKVGEVFAKPERAARFMAYPGVTEMADSPKILALRADPEITKMLQQGRLWDLLQDARLIEAANDPALAKQLKKFDLRRALDYAADDSEH